MQKEMLTVKMCGSAHKGVPYASTLEI